MNGWEITGGDNCWGYRSTFTPRSLSKVVKYKFFSSEREFLSGQDLIICYLSLYVRIPDMFNHNRAGVELIFIPGVPCVTLACFSPRLVIIMLLQLGGCDMDKK